MVGPNLINNIMKAQILKHTGLTEAEFYAKYKDPASFHNSKEGKTFKAKYGSALKKAQYGGNPNDKNNDGVPDYLQDYGMQTINPQNPYGQYFGGAQMPQRNYKQESMQDATNTMQEFGKSYINNSGQGFGNTMKGMFSGGDAGNGGLGKAFGDIGKSFGIGGGGGATGATGAAGGAGKGISGALGGGGKGGGMGNAGGYIEAVMSIVEGVGALKGEKKMKKKAYSDRNTVEIVRQAYDSEDVNKRQNYMDSAKRTRNALIPTVDADALFPTYGVGTNILSKNGAKLKAQSGKKIKDVRKKGDLVRLPADWDIDRAEEYIPTTNSIKDVQKRDTVGSTAAKSFTDWYTNPETVKRFGKNTGFDSARLQDFVQRGLDTPSRPFSSGTEALDNNGNPMAGQYLPPSQINKLPKGQILYDPTGDPSLRGGDAQGVNAAITHEFGHASGMDTTLGPALMRVLGDPNKQKTKNTSAKNKKYLSRPEESYGNFHQFRMELGLKPGEKVDATKLKKLVDEKKRGSNMFYQAYDDDKIVKAINTIASTNNTSDTTYAAHGAEIMNTYDPGTLYDDLGYEPLGESTFQPMSHTEILKAYKSGGLLKAQYGGNQFQSFMGSEGMNQVANQIGQNNQMLALGNNYSQSANIGKFDNAGSKIGSGIGQAVGTYFGGPLGGMVGKWAGKYVGGAVDPNYRKIKGANSMKEDDLNYMRNSSGFENIRTSQYSAYTKNGGVINKYRSGGSMRSDQNGDINIDHRGDLEPISYNPNTGGTGFTSMIQGPSHDDGGTNVAFSGNTVNAEGGEPISVRDNGGQVGESAIIAGDQTFGKFGVALMPHLEKYEGKKIKNIQKDIAEKDAKLNKFDVKNTKEWNNFIPLTPIDKLKDNAYAKNFEGIQQKYKINAREVDDLLAYQEAINNTAEIMGADAGDLSRGKIKYIPQKERYAQTGVTLPANAQGNTNPNATYTNTTGLLDYTPVGPQNENFSSEDVYAKFKEDTEKAYDDPEIAKQLVDYFRNYEGADWKDVRSAINKGRTFEEQRQIAKKLATDHFPGRFHVNLTPFTKPTLVVNQDKISTTPKLDANYDVTPYRQTGLETAANMILPWIRKSPGMDLDMNQISGELSALTDQADPVQARFYNPNLRTPYDVSYQDQLNENQADFNQLTKVAADNPQQLAALAAGKYAANSKVLGEQFRANQAQREQVYTQNTNILNDALLKNLSIADQQYVRQSTAKSNTKQVRAAALNSIALKTNQNRLNNQKLQVGSNEFRDFSYDTAGRLLKTGAPTTFNIPQKYTPSSSKLTHAPMYDKDGNFIGYQEIDKEDLKKEARNGAIVKAFKNL